MEDLKSELAEERDKAIWMEEALLEAKKECMDPFVVPALMEAFVLVSSTTKRLLDSADLEEGPPAKRLRQ